MKALYIKDKHKRNKFLKIEQRYKLLKSLSQNVLLSSEVRLFVAQKLANLVKKGSSITKLRNRCTVTFRSRSTSRGFKLSRIRLRELFSLGLVPGYKKSAW